MSVIAQALKRALIALAKEKPTLQEVSLNAMAHTPETMERLAELVVAPAPADQGDRVVIGDRAYDMVTPPKRYPPLTIAIKHGVVRGLGIMLGRVEHNTKTSQKLCFRLLKIIDAELVATEKRTGEKYPGGAGRYLWDDEIGEIELVLTDVEMVIFGDLFLDAINARRGSWPLDKHRSEPPYADALYKINRAIGDHFVKHGGYDHSKSVDNIFSHDPESAITLAYANRGETL